MPSLVFVDIDEHLRRHRAGDPRAAEEAIELVYQPLRSYAAQLMRGQAPGHTLQATALVNEALARLLQGEGLDCNDTRHFLRRAARAMRSVLVDHARKKRAAKRAPPGHRQELDMIVERFELHADGDLVALDLALARLAERDERQAAIAELRFFLDLSRDDIGKVVGCSPEEVARELSCARAWLRSRSHDAR